MNIKQDCFCVYRNSPFKGFNHRIEGYSCIKCCFKRQFVKNDKVLRYQLVSLLQQVNINIVVDIKVAEKNFNKFNLVLQTKRKTINDMDYELILEYLQVKERYDDQKKKMNDFLADFEAEYVRQIGSDGEPQLPFSMPENIMANPELIADMFNETPVLFKDFVNLDEITLD